MHDFKKFKVWEKSRQISKEIYLISRTFPDTERFGVTSQIRRAAISISNNIAEGSGRSSDKEFVQFLHYAYGSAVEVENIIILSYDLELINEEDFKGLNSKIIEIQKMLYSLIQKLKS